ncbi:helix-turn-helix transcriptional regulator [Erythrobacter sp. KY5]|uniref:helix-turn-helix transcriptional regulator n=1 Tax=Erythrobacter sp. KY5 TaxID=2011159 RepID=UPI0013A6BB95|nr:helix-turn-helix transcriptional regulator [Erythrobacter sp. KY5]
MTHALSDGEGTLLSLIERAQPVTVYEISKIYASSPVTHFGTSKGKLYPMVRRLKELGLLLGEEIAGDRRRTEHLRCTKVGLAALRDWAKRVDPEHLLLEDPLRTRIQSLHLLDLSEQVAWLEQLAKDMRAKIAEVQSYVEETELPETAIMFDNVRATSEARLGWVERTLGAIRERKQSD